MRLQSLVVVAFVEFSRCTVPSAIAAEATYLIRFGLLDRSPSRWDASVSAKDATVADISGWRFEDTDHTLGTSGWIASTRYRLNRRDFGTPQAKSPATIASQRPLNASTADNGVLVSLANVSTSAEIEISFPRGRARFKLSDISYGNTRSELNSAVEIQRVADVRRLSSPSTLDEFPSIARGPSGEIYLAYISFVPGISHNEIGKVLSPTSSTLPILGTPAGGDQLWLRVRDKTGNWQEPKSVTLPGRDLFKTSISVTPDGTAWLFWAENLNWPKSNYPGLEDGRFQLWARSYKNGQFSNAVRISDRSGNHHSPASIVDDQGRVWVVWMGTQGERFRIFARYLNPKGHWSRVIQVSTHAGNSWSPTIATTAGRKKGRIAILWDTYEKGDYDIWLREAEGTRLGPARPVANTERFEARPAAAYDSQGHLWVTWEESGIAWGKDVGTYTAATATALYSDRKIGLTVIAPDGRALEPVVPIPTMTRPEYNSASRIVRDDRGRMWLFFRSRLMDFEEATLVGSIWSEFALIYDGSQWLGPILIPNSDNRLSSPLSVVSTTDGVDFAFAGDHRRSHRGRARLSKKAGSQGVRDHDIYVGRLSKADVPRKIDLRPANTKAVIAKDVSHSAMREFADIARCRKHIVRHNGRSLRLLRGEFHRHTEMSIDGGDDGSLEDMWRYFIDGAGLDWGANSDHNAGGTEFQWWLIQKFTDAFQLHGRFESLFSYERSIPFPDGHRNIIFPRRGIRYLNPIKVKSEAATPSNDTHLLYSYLKLFDGLAATHTSATSSWGTTWLDSDPAVEPMTEIYQGQRQSYERAESPRSASTVKTIGGYNAKGYISEALKKGVRFAFEASSDHRSSHMSYTGVYAETNTREAIFRAMKARHIYAATDNIIAEFTSHANGREYMMGDEFITAKPPSFRIRLHGTAPFRRVVLVKDDIEIELSRPNKAEVMLDWQDPSPTPGKTSYYYIRGEQEPSTDSENGELVWISPMWVTFAPKSATP